MGLPKRGIADYEAMIARRFQFHRKIVEANQLKGAWEYWLACGHGMKLLVEEQCYLVGDSMSCLRCKKAALAGTDTDVATVSNKKEQDEKGK